MVKFNINTTRGSSPQLFDPQQVVVYKNYSRHHLDDASIDKMMAEILELGGQRNPGWVTKIPDLYGEAPVLIAGERRLKALIKLNDQQTETAFKFSAYYIATKNESERIDLCLSENAHRQEITWLDKSFACGEMSRLSYRQDQMAKKLGVATTEVHYLLRLLELVQADKQILQSATAGQLSYTGAIALLPYRGDPDTTKKILDTAVLSKAQSSERMPAEVKVTKRDIDTAATESGSSDSVCKSLSIKGLKDALTTCGGKVQHMKTLFNSLELMIEGTYSISDFCDDCQTWTSTILADHLEQLKNDGKISIRK